MNNKYLKLAVLLLGLAFTPFVQAATDWSAEDYDLYSGDFNGDGKSDILYVAKDPTKSSGIAITTTTTGDTYWQAWPSNFLGISWSDGNFNVIVADFDGYGKAGILLQRKTAGDSYLLLVDNYGKISGVNQTIPSVDQYGVSWTADKHKIIAGYFIYKNGNAAADVFLQATTPGGTNYIVHGSTRYGTLLANAPTQSWGDTEFGFNWSTQSSNVFAVDANHDGLDDLLVQAKPKWVMIDYDVSFPIPTYLQNKNGLILSAAVWQSTAANVFNQASVQQWSRFDFGVDWSPLTNTIVVDSLLGNILLVPLHVGGTFRQVRGNYSGQIISALGVTTPSWNGIATPSSDSYRVIPLKNKLNGLSWSGLYLQSLSPSGTNYTYTATFPNGQAIATPQTTSTTAAALGALAVTTQDRTDGNATVSVNGEASYTIPLKLPAGANSLTPKLALTYGSNQGTGTVAVSGLSAISRCNKTLAQNGANAAVALTTADRFCLDGNQLKLVSGSSYGAAGTEYRTEIDGISRITVLALSSVGDPSYFKVERKDGTIYEYGNTSDSRIESIRTGFTSIARTWAVNKITDRAGNAITFTYEEDGNPNDNTKPTGGYRVIAINYSSNSAQGIAAPYSVVFNYAAKTTGEIIAERYLAGGKLIDRRRLNYVAIKYVPTAVLLREYRLNYESTASTAGRVRLHSIQECAAGTEAQPSDCLVPTAFSYQDGAPNYADSYAAGAIGDEVTAGTTIPSVNGLMVIDINGDGRTDLVYPSTATVSGSGTGVWVYRLADPAYSSGFAPAVTTSYSSAYYDVALVTDYNNDGRDDILTKDASSNWYALLGSATGFSSSVSTGLNTASIPVSKALSVDYNGDGMKDLVWSTLTTGTNPVGSVVERDRLSSGGYSGPNNWLASGYTGTDSYGLSYAMGFFDDWGTGQRSKTRDADVNADGNDDVPIVRRSCYYGTCNATGSLHAIAFGGGLGVGGSFSDDDNFNTGARFSNINRDQYTDIVALGSDGKIHYRISNGTGGYDQGVVDSSINGGYESVAYQFDKAIQIDWNDDGFDDLLVPYPYAGYEWTALHINTGNGFAKLQNAKLGATWSSSSGSYIQDQTQLPVAVYRMDINGDGLDDVGYVKPDGTFAYRLHVGVKSDLLTQVSDGYGNATTFSYKSINQAGGCYTRDSAPTFPTALYTEALYTVCKQTNSDGVGGTYDINYSYSNASRDLQGRGFLGFQKRVVTDTRTGIKTTETYNQTFPFIGRLMSKVVAQSDGSLIQELTNSYLANSYGTGAEVYQYPYLSQSVTKSYEVNASSTYNNKLVSTQTQTVSAPNAYGVSSSTTTTVSEAATANGLQSGATYTLATIKSGFQDSASAWCFDKPGTVTVTSSHSQTFGSAIVRTANRSWDVSSACRLSSETTAAGTAYAVTRTINEYDGFGNIKKETVSDTDSTTLDRVTQTTWDSTGRFPLTIKNAANETTGFDWYYDIGRKKTATSPNNTVAQWSYDNFGELSTETAVDGTRTLYGAIEECKASNSYCSTSNALVRTKLRISKRDSTTANGGTGNEISYEDRYLDRFERTVEVRTPALNGAVSVVRTRYDNRGLAYQKSAPFFLGATAYFASTGYDLLGRPTSVSRFRSATDTTAVTSTINYRGLTTVTKDPKGYETTKIVNAAGKLIRVTDPTYVQKRFEYDAFGSLKQVRDMDDAEIFAASYDYGVDAFQVSTDDKDHGAWIYQYYPTGELKYQKDANLKETTYTYDALGRQLTRSENEGTTNWYWGASSSSYNVGQLDYVTSPSGYAERNCFDATGRLAKKLIRTTSGTPSTCASPSDDATNNFAYDYAYDSTTGLLDTLQYPTSTSSYRLKVKYNYQNGIMNKVSDANASTTVFWQANATDARGQLSDEQLGTNGRVYSSYDPVTGQPITRQTMAGTGATTTATSLGFAWDDNSNLLRRYDYSQSLTEEFTYDARNTLDYATLNGTTNLDVTVDGYGNLTYKSDVGTYTYDSTKKRRLVSTSNGWTFGYDSNGNMTTYKGASNAIGWTSYNYPSSITANGKNSVFSYGPDRELFKQVGQYVNGTETTLYVGGLLERVTGPGLSGGTVTSFRHYIRAGNTTAIYTRFDNSANPETRYLTEDHIGSNSVILSDDGSVLAKLSYDAYGKRRGSNWSGVPTSTTGGEWDQISRATREGYTGQTELDNLGLIHMNGRVQDPTLGRFLSADPFVSDPGNVQNYNRYSYVYNNPLTYTDPSGFICSVYDVDVYTSNGKIVGYDITGQHSCDDTNRWLPDYNFAVYDDTGFRDDAAAMQLQAEMYAYQAELGKQILRPVLDMYEDAGELLSNFLPVGPEAGLAKGVAKEGAEMLAKRTSGSLLAKASDFFKSASESAKSLLNKFKSGKVEKKVGEESATKGAHVGSPTAGKPVDSSTRARILARDQKADGSWECATCGQSTSNPANVHTGHVTPRSKGGDLSDGNLRCEGAACNLSQGNRDAPKPGMTCKERGSCGAPYGRSD